MASIVRVLLTSAAVYIAYAIAHGFIISLDIGTSEFAQFLTSSVEMAVEFTCSITYCCGAYMHSRRTALRLLDYKLSDNLFGQPLAVESIQQIFTDNYDDFILGAPISLHLSGPTGTGKSYACKLIAESLYSKGLESEIVHTFEGNDLFMNNQETEYYQNNLRNWIQGNLTICNRTMFIFENIEKMPQEFLEATRPFLTNKMGGIFIFTTTKVNPEIIEMYKELRNEGVIQPRYPVIKYKKNALRLYDSGDKDLLARNDRKCRIIQMFSNDDNPIPGEEKEYQLPTTGQAIFLPLELKDLKYCMLEEFERLGRFVPTECEIQKIFNILQYKTHHESMVSCKDVIEIAQWVVKSANC